MKAHFYLLVGASMLGACQYESDPTDAESADYLDGESDASDAEVVDDAPLEEATPAVSPELEGRAELPSDQDIIDRLDQDEPDFSGGVTLYSSGDFCTPTQTYTYASTTCSVGSLPILNIKVRGGLHCYWAEVKNLLPGTNHMCAAISAGGYVYWGFSCAILPQNGVLQNAATWWLDPPNAVGWNEDWGVSCVADSTP
ncbi:MAG: hypothetical protein HOW73_15915 [Polyangiaceae bacterium]|nr:hypothetical protein [Polyangiaceae bacterium]